MVTNVPKPTFGPRGFSIPSTTEVLDGVLQDTDNAFGGGMNLELDTPQGQLSTSETAVIDDANSTFLLYTQLVDPAYSFGRMQDAIGRIYFIERFPARPTAVTATCTGLAGVVIPIGALAVSVDGFRYICVDGGTIPVSGSIDLQWQCTVDGPIACPAGALNQIYQAIPGWDAINNTADGIIGANVESRAQFEARRAASVAKNSIGSLPSVLGAVLAVEDVLDAFVTENVNNSVLVVGGYTLLPNSLYVAAVGGNSEDIAKAIWTKKAPGCAYNGNTQVTVLDDSEPYQPPYPAYTVRFERPANLPIAFKVNIANSVLVPANAEELIQNAIINAFTGADDGQRARIGQKLYASRYYTPVALLGPWARIVSITVDSPNTPDAEFTASITGTTMTVTAVADGTLEDDQVLIDASGDMYPGTQIISQLSGTPGGTGDYEVSATQNLSSTSLVALNVDQFEVSVDIDQVPTINANDIKLILS